MMRSWADWARAAGQRPGEAIYVRLYYDATQFIPAFADGEVATFFETVKADNLMVNATLRLVATKECGLDTYPVVVIDSVQKAVA